MSLKYFPGFLLSTLTNHILEVPGTTALSLRLLWTSKVFQILFPIPGISFQEHFILFTLSHLPMCPITVTRFQRHKILLGFRVRSYSVAAWDSYILCWMPSVSPGHSTSNPASRWCVPGRKQVVQILRSLHPYGRPRPGSMLLALTWPSTGCCSRHLRSEPVDVISLSLSAFQIEVKIINVF